VRTFDSIGKLPLPAYGSGEVVALKLHMGERGNPSHVTPDDVAALVLRIQKAGASVFVTDTTTLYQRKRASVEDYLETARLNGFSEDRIGCPVTIADAGGGSKQGRVELAKGIMEADSLLVFSHATGHITTGFAGALKNLAMGCATKVGKRHIHSAGWPRYRREVCRECGECVEACPFGFLVLEDGIELNLKNCPACERCLNACKNGALWRQPGAMEECYARYAETIGAILDHFPGAYFINEVNRVTRYCDCSVDPGQTISPDLGFLAGTNPVEIDEESVRIICEASPEAGEAFGGKWREFIHHVSEKLPQGQRRTARRRC
jgi:uncharacterized Fe-S center protein